MILRIYKGDKLIEVKQFTEDQISIGHGANVHLDLKDEAVSPIHCLIELRDSGFYICDLGSASGTLKNNNVILDEPLSSGDYIGVGPYRVQFFVGVPKPKAAPDEITQYTAVAEVKEESVPQVRQTPAPTPPKLPEVAPAVVPSVRSTAGTKKQSAATINLGRRKKGQKTFPPPSEITDLRKHLKGTKGPTIEVIVTWKERVLSTYHFTDQTRITIGSKSGADVFVPGAFFKKNLSFIESSGATKLNIPADVNFDVVSSGQNFSQEDLLRLGKAVRATSGHSLRLEQGEIGCLSIADGQVEIFVRHIPGTAKPALAGTLDLSSNEITGLILSLIIVSLVALYMSIYAPIQEELKKDEEQLRLATIVYNRPPPPPDEEPPPPPVPPKKEPVETPKPKEEPKRVLITERETKQGNKKQSQNTAKQVEKAKAAEVRPTPSKTNRPKKFTSVKQGGAVKTGKAEGSNATSKEKDVTQMGLLSAFSGGGARKQLDQAYQGSQGLLGMANEATGSSGSNANRDGDDLGSRFKDTGAGGRGTRTQGIADVGTKGRGSGMSEYGSGVGLGGKSNVTIDAGGVEEGWEGTIDREAVRRVIRSILNQIKSCYERQLRMNSSLEGKVVIRFEIVDQGRVRTASTKSTTMRNSAVESCVAARIRAARFPEPPQGVIAVVDYPFVFGSQK